MIKLFIIVINNFIGIKGRLATPLLTNGTSNLAVEPVGEAENQGPKKTIGMVHLDMSAEDKEVSFMRGIAVVVTGKLNRTDEGNI